MWPCAHSPNIEHHTLATEKPQYSMLMSLLSLETSTSLKIVRHGSDINIRTRRSATSLASLLDSPHQCWT